MKTLETIQVLDLKTVWSIDSVSRTAFDAIHKWMLREEQKYVLEIAEKPESSNVGRETCSTTKAGSTSKACTTG